MLIWKAQLFLNTVFSSEPSRRSVLYDINPVSMSHVLSWLSTFLALNVVTLNHVTAAQRA